jgi:hypothetical protein
MRIAKPKTWRNFCQKKYYWYNLFYNPIKFVVCDKGGFLLDKKILSKDDRNTGTLELGQPKINWYIFLLFKYWNYIYFFQATHELFPTKLLFIVEVNCRFIDTHPCLDSILNVFHNKIYKPYPLMLLQQW